MICSKLSICLRVIGFLLLMPLISSVTLSKSPVSTYSITVTVKKMRNTKGYIQFQVYRNQSSFAAENPYKIYRVSKKNAENGILTYTIPDLPAGTYGVALLDDENSNKEMDYGFLMPKEGFGFSDYYHTSWSKPVFNDFKFELNADKKVTMIVRYV